MLLRPAIRTAVRLPKRASSSIPFSRSISTIPSTRAHPSSSNSFLQLRPRPRQTHHSVLTRPTRRHLTDNVRAAIDKAVASAPVVLFMKGTPDTPQCGFSRASIQILGLQGVDPGKFTAFNVLEDEELRQGIKEYSDWPTIPQLYVSKEFVGGCDILISMHQSGELAKMLEEKGVLVPASEEGGDGGAAAQGTGGGDGAGKGGA
ncbi:monothiol glutaredoxin grx5 [Trapelia coarctata]|nr:monothiol glutaredoxin grx5 [Trapelia coarctata]